MPCTPLKLTLALIHETRSSGAAVKETSYYGAVERLFNDIGADNRATGQCQTALRTPAGRRSLTANR